MPRWNRSAGVRRAALFGAFAWPALAGAAGDDLSRQLANLSLEQLMAVEVTTVAGTTQSRMSAPAALYVISAEDIKRSGHRTVAEALRLVPGMYVGRINSSSWVIGARGLTGSSLTATRYLVLVDGRVVHDPLLSTTFWDVIDLVIDDVDRIEVIRGPGATLWGANAMNGVINVISRNASQTAGNLVRVGIGNYDKAYVAARHGATTARGDSYRVWTKYTNRRDFDGPDGKTLHDEWSALHGGFRYDATRGDIAYTLQGDAYTEPTAMASVRNPVPGAHQQFEQVTGNDDVDGANVLFRAYRGVGIDGGWSLQAYYDRASRETSRFGVDRQTADVDYRRWARWGERDEVIWGVQYTHISDRIENGPVLQLSPASRDWSTTNAFVQDTHTLVEDRVFAMVGSKFTWHDFVGFAAQPSVRLWWTPSDSQTFWAAVSRPVRVPSRFEENGRLIFGYVDTGLIRGAPATGVIIPLDLSGSDDLEVERLVAYEIGHRFRAGDRWTIDTTMYFNDYSDLVSVPPAIFGKFSNAGSGETLGIDISATYQATPAWRLEGSYSFVNVLIHGPVFNFEERSSPRNLAQLRSYLDIGDDWEFNAALYHVDRNDWLAVDAYQRLDLGVTWRPRAGVEVALWGQNLLEDHHAEGSGARVPREVHAQLTYYFGD